MATRVGTSGFPPGVGNGVGVGDGDTLGIGVGDALMVIRRE
jgi:hypothetical protein